MQVKRKLLDVFKTGVDTGTSGAPKGIIMDVAGRVKDIEKNCSKTVDENGVPLVVYHGTDRADLDWRRQVGVFTMRQSRAVHQRRAGCTPDFIRLMVERGFTSDTIIELEDVKRKFFSTMAYIDV